MQPPTSAPKKYNLRSVLTKRNPVGGQNPVVLLERIDDEKERSDRRSMVVEKRYSNNLSASSSIIDINQRFIEKNQMEDHMKMCTKLFTDNKITIKNAWELHIIDIIREITSGNNKNMFQIAGTSLDIGAKVYGLRVDDVHNKGLLLASSLVKQYGDQVSQNPGNKKRSVVGKQKKRKLTGGRKSTVDTEGKSLFAPLEELQSVMFSCNKNIDVADVANLFTCKLRVNPGNRELMLMSPEKYWSTSSDLAIHRTEIIDIELPKVKDFTMCQPLNNFTISEEGQEQGEKQLEMNVVCDDAGLPIAELDGEINDIFKNDGVSPEEFQAPIDIVDTVPEEYRIETDYGYCPFVMNASGIKYIEKIWAGPNHWKVKFIRPSEVKFSGNVQQVAARTPRRPKVYEPTDFNILLNHQDMTVREKVRVIEPRVVAFEKITLPYLDGILETFHKQTNELMSKPGVLYPNLYRGPREAQEAQASNSTHAQGSLQNQMDCGDNDEPLHHSFHKEGEAPAATQSCLNAPDMVPFPQVCYSMRAKNMDMRKLKNAIWQQLTQTGGGPENCANPPNLNPTKFSTIYKELPNFLSAEMKKQLSSSLVLFALLDLCNANNLELVQDPGDKDFTVMRARQ